MVVVAAAAALFTTVVANVVPASAGPSPLVHTTGTGSWSCDGATRFTLLSDRALRAEFGRFEDRRSFSFAGVGARKATPGVSFLLQNGSGWCNATVAGSGLRVDYRLASVSDATRRSADPASSAPFVRHALQLSLPSGVHWQAGDDGARGNLGGTISNLCGKDGAVPLNCTGETAPSVLDTRGLPKFCTLGVASREGWAHYDDSFSAVLDESGWAQPRTLVDNLPAPWERQQDIYIFMYGDDFVGAAAALAAVSGAQPLPPRHMLGVGFSRYWQFASTELRGIVREMQRHGLPLDTLNLDTGWHENFCFRETPSLCSKQLVGGAKKKELLGYSGMFEWDSDLFPGAPTRALRRWLAHLGLSSYLDVHQGAGVMPQNRGYTAIAEWAGIDPASREPVTPLALEDKQFVKLYFDMLETQVGDDLYYWIDLDGDGGAYSKLASNDTEKGGVGIHRFNSVLWNLWLFYKDAERRTGRGSNLVWWAGLGTQRYPLGHSGDIQMTWGSLAFAPVFTATAANVNFGWWDHDVGGHQQGPNNTVSHDPELYLRWIQWSVYAPTFRTHMERGAENRPQRTQFYWQFDDFFAAPMRVALRQRSRLVPYIYTLAVHAAVDLAPSPVRPMYYHFPRDQAVYGYQAQVMLGADVLVAPVLTKRNLAVNLTAHTVYMPREATQAGSSDASDCAWVQMNTLTCMAAGVKQTGQYAMHEVPAFVRAGTMLPMSPGPQAVKSTSDASFGAITSTNAASDAMATVASKAGGGDDRQPLLGGAAAPPRTLVWETWPGLAASGSGEVLEDDPTSTEYKTGAVARTNASFALRTSTATNATIRLFSFEVSAVQGSYLGAFTHRNYELVLHGFLIPRTVEVETPTGWQALPMARPAHHDSLERCGRVSCGATARAGTVSGAWWWEAKALRTSVRVDEIDVHTGVRLRASFGHPARVYDVHPHLDFVGMFGRVARIKTMLDGQYWLGARPSRAMNALAETADRMQIDPASAATELATFSSRVAHALAMHTGENCSSDTKIITAEMTRVQQQRNGSSPSGCPTKQFQDLMRAWLGSS